MPRYRIEWRAANGSGNGNGSWTGSREVDTETTVPSIGSPVVEAITNLPNGQALEFRVVRLDAIGNETAVVSDVRSATPSRFTLDGADPFDRTVRLAWTDQTQWLYYRVERWTTNTDGPSLGDIITTEVTFETASATRSVDISGLTNGVQHRFRVNRIAEPLAAVTRTADNVLTATPQSGFDPPPEGFTATGPSVVDGNLKAQFAVDATGRTGILISTKVSSYTAVVVTYMASGEEPGLVTTEWGSPSAFNAGGFGPTVTQSAKLYFVYVPRVLGAADPFPITIPGSSPPQQGARVFLDSQGATQDFQVEPTYV